MKEMKGNSIIILSTILAGLFFLIAGTCLTVIFVLDDMNITEAMLKNNHMLDYHNYIVPFYVSVVCEVLSVFGIAYGTSKDYYGDRNWKWIR